MEIFTGISNSDSNTLLMEKQEFLLLISAPMKTDFIWLFFHIKAPFQAIPTNSEWNSTCPYYGRTYTHPHTQCVHKTQILLNLLNAWFLHFKLIFYLYLYLCRSGAITSKCDPINCTSQNAQKMWLHLTTVCDAGDAVFVFENNPTKWKSTVAVVCTEHTVRLSGSFLLN